MQFFFKRRYKFWQILTTFSDFPFTLRAVIHPRHAVSPKHLVSKCCFLFALLCFFITLKLEKGFLAPVLLYVCQSHHTSASRDAFMPNSAICTQMISQNIGMRYDIKSVHVCTDLPYCTCFRLEPCFTITC